MFKCHICKKVTAHGQYNYQDLFTCADCETMTEYLHLDEFTITEEGVERRLCLSDKTEEEQRWELIHLIYRIYDNKINKRVFHVIPQYLKKGYTYLGIIRAMEYHFIVRRSSTAKANNGIGIVPYVYDDAQKYFESVNSKHYLQYLKHHQNKHTLQPIKRVTILEAEKPKRNQVDMGSL